MIPAATDTAAKTMRRTEEPLAWADDLREDLLKLSDPLSLKAPTARDVFNLPLLRIKAVLWFSSLCHLRIFAGQIEIVLHRSPAFPQIQHGPQRTSAVIFRPLDGCGQVKALCQIGSNGAGQGTASDVRVGGINAGSTEPGPRTVRIEKIVGVIDVMPAFEQDSTAVCAVDFFAAFSMSA